MMSHKKQLSHIRSTVSHFCTKIMQKKNLTFCAYFEKIIRFIVEKYLLCIVLIKEQSNYQCDFLYIFQLKMAHSAWVFVFLFMDTRLQTKTHSRIFQFSEKVIWWEECITINERLCYSVIFPIPSPLILWSKAFKILKKLSIIKL